MILRPPGVYQFLSKRNEWCKTNIDENEKSEFYEVSAAAANGKYVYTMFSSRDEDWHDKLRKSVNWIFTPSAAASYEPIVDNTLRVLHRVIHRRFASNPNGGVLDLAEWSLYFTLDVMGDLTYNRRYGFLEKGEDVDGFIALMRRFLAYGLFVSQCGIKVLLILNVRTVPQFSCECTKHCIFSKGHVLIFRGDVTIRFVQPD